MDRKIVILMALISVFMLGACSSGDETTRVEEPYVEDVVEGNDKEGDTDKEYEALLEEADEFAEEVRKAFATNNFERIAELGTDKTLENIKGYGIDLEGEEPTERFHYKYYEDALDFAGDFYTLYRLEDLYDESEGHFWYGTIYMRVGSAMLEQIEEIETDEERIKFLEYNLVTSTKTLGRDRKVFVIKKDDDGEWVLGTFLDRLSDFKSLNLSDEERERIIDNKVYIHELPEVEEDNSLF